MIMNTYGSSQRINSRLGLGGLKIKAAVALLASAAVGLAFAAPAAASASTVTYGETAQFHCEAGVVRLDNIRMPYAEVPVAWQATVYYYSTAGTWVPYESMVTPGGSASQYITSTYQDASGQQIMSASVPRGHYYAVRVYVYYPQPHGGYVAHWDWAQISYAYEGTEGEGTYCAA
jgi:hypothetical protein